MKFYSSFRKQKKIFKKEKNCSLMVRYTNKKSGRISSVSKRITGQVMRIVGSRENIKEKGYTNKIGAAFLQAIGIEVYNQYGTNNA